MDGVKFDQINSAVMEVVESYWRKSQLWWRSVCMGVAYLMSGTKGEEYHQAYKEGDGIHRGHSKYFLCLVSYDFLHASIV